MANSRHGIGEHVGSVHARRCGFRKRIACHTKVRRRLFSVRPCATAQSNTVPESSQVPILRGELSTDSGLSL